VDRPSRRRAVGFDGGPQRVEGVLDDDSSRFTGSGADVRLGHPVAEAVEGGGVERREVHVLPDGGDRTVRAHLVEIVGGQVPVVVPGALVVAEAEHPLPIRTPPGVEVGRASGEQIDRLPGGVGRRQIGVDQSPADHRQMRVGVDKARENDPSLAVANRRLDACELVHVERGPDGDDPAVPDGEGLGRLVGVFQRVDLGVRQD
jgi:hypothetical protein